jgi:hypothetical protein
VKFDSGILDETCAIAGTPLDKISEVSGLNIFPCTGVVGPISPNKAAAVFQQ